MYDIKLGSNAVAILLANGNQVWSSPLDGDESIETVWVVSISAGTLREALDTVSHLYGHSAELTNLWQREIYRAKSALRPR